MQDTMVSTRDLPWMKLGTVIDKPMTPGEAIRRAELDWTVEKFPVYAEVNGDFVEVPKRHVIKRSSDDEIMGIVGERYETYQNSEAFDFLTGVVDDPDDATIVAAGSIRNGRQVFMVVEYPDTLDDVLDDKDHKLYTIVRTGHDGTKAIEVVVMPLRQKCMNMLSLRSFGRDAKQRWSVQHTSTLQARMAEARNTLDRVDDYAEEYRRMADRLVGIEMNEERLSTILDRILPDRPRIGDTKQGIITNLYESPTIDDHFRETGYGAINSITEYLDWGRDRVTDVGRYNSALDGFSAKMRDRATALILAA